MKVKYTCGDALYCDKKYVRRVLEAELKYYQNPIRVTFAKNEIDISNMSGSFLLVGIKRYGLNREVKLTFTYFVIIEQ